jgi:D-alanine-D-alanine ligase
MPDADLPLVIKPPREGSSVGLHIVQDASQWAQAVTDAFTHDKELLVETFVTGRELTVGVLGNAPLPVIEIKPHSGVYDYESKYTKGCTDYIVPAEIPEEIAAEAQNLALKTYQCLGCRGFGRVDLIWSPEQGIHVLELNTLPGFTETSLLPKSAQAAGLNFSELCDRIIALAQVG